ncbi:hypothetical protein [Martelella mangrovi]|uniref:Ig-like domain-containing protein n=1 Tax=Martelella mangrovi TaxID=1397477 RepID=A0ABV2IH25_9HYPH
MEKAAILACAFSLVASAVAAQQTPPSEQELMQQERDYMNFAPAPKSEDGSFTTLGGCTAYDKPQIPLEWFQGYPSGRILEMVYVHQVAANIEAAGKCTCELRFPPYDKALAEYQTKIAPLDNEDAEWIPDYVNEGYDLASQINKYCKSQGVR